MRSNRPDRLERKAGPDDERGRSFWHCKLFISCIFFFLFIFLDLFSFLGSFLRPLLLPLSKGTRFVIPDPSLWSLKQLPPPTANDIRFEQSLFKYQSNLAKQETIKHDKNNISLVPSWAPWQSPSFGEQRRSRLSTVRLLWTKFREKQQKMELSGRESCCLCF